MVPAFSVPFSQCSPGRLFPSRGTPSFGLTRPRGDIAQGAAGQLGEMLGNASRAAVYSVQE